MGCGSSIRRGGGKKLIPFLETHGRQSSSVNGEIVFW